MGRPQAYNLQCGGACTAQHCCLHPTTPTTTPPTCVSFVCPATWVKRPQAYNLQCNAACTAQQCCWHPTTTPPAGPCSTSQPAGPSPCTTHGPVAIAKLYAAKGDAIKYVNAETQPAVTTSPAWALPVIGTLALLCCCLAGARALNTKTRAAKVDPRDRYTTLTPEEAPVEAEFEGDSARGMLLPNE